MRIGLLFYTYTFGEYENQSPHLFNLNQTNTKQQPETNGWPVGTFCVAMGKYSAVCNSVYAMHTKNVINILKLGACNSFVYENTFNCTFKRVLIKKKRRRKDWFQHTKTMM